MFAYLGLKEERRWKIYLSAIFLGLSLNVRVQSLFFATLLLAMTLSLVQGRRTRCPVEGARLLRNRTGNFKRSHRPVQQFGQAEVTCYRGKTARALLEERLPSGQSADHWRSLAERCRAESPAARNVPR